MLGAARYVSASELYCADEVELLLEEIRELEPTSCRGEEVQDFEIAGSGAGGAGGRSPAGTDLTDHSWDSHAHYSRAPPPRPMPLAPLYCRFSHLLEPMGAIALVLVLCCICVCVCVWAALGLRGTGDAKPLLFGALTSAMLHTLIMVMHITRLDELLPLDWNKLGGCGCAWSAAWLAGGAAAALLAPPAHSALLYTAAGSGLCGASAAALGVGVSLRGGWRARAAAHRAAYRAVPAPPPPPAHPAPSTSRAL